MPNKSIIINLLKKVFKIFLTTNDAPKRLNKKNAIPTNNSSQIASINYSTKKWILEVEFKPSNKVYHYLGVTPEIWRQFKYEVEHGGSAGKFFNGRIRGRYEAVKINN